ncbi:LPS export ABC transporter periplasmic protein LptC [Luteimonas sp. SX5]|uniref:Lipopolysaccharide export system protein LptC n=1 Tax=Luteimonas galliterrae TaxID=2940486 RepID=A0ABT0MK57_9GAMM|nr:LPS export ABC transporter periplasmic protein LptC [Luteimonas galliterrae]MCL1635246.1 LPS export ABC transporter periplasmic protein LptC [Luteimonas galliterrae]
MTTWRGLLGLLLLLAAVFSGWSLWKQHQRGQPSAVRSDRPDYVLKDFEVVALDKQGKEAFTLRAPHLKRRPDDKTMTLDTPLFLFPDKDGAYWQTRSRSAWVSAKADEVRLTGDVNVDSPPGTARPVKMVTSQLNVFPDASLARTPELVTVTQPGFILRGRGFETNLKTKQYQFKSQVRSSYDPSTRR